jgi:eukaryotic-like serine/threonine-protein kinase
MQLTAGSLLQGGKYLINHPLETQGFGVTYRGTQTYHGQPVVIKTLHPALHKSRAYNRLRDRFIDIASILTRCQHPSIVRVIELFQEGDLPFVVMEYVPGQKLTDLVKPGQTMAEMEALHYIRLIGAALTISHRFGLVHGNLTPQNIIRRGGSNVPVLVGYGISAERMLAAVQYAVPGFPHAFNAPEQIGETGDRVPSADIYALTANFYYLLTGHAPMPAKERPTADLVDQLPLLSLLNPSLQAAIVQGLALNPKQRPKTIDEWLTQLPGNNIPRTAARPEILPTIERSTRQPTPPTVPQAFANAPTQLEPPAPVQPVQPAPTLRLDPPPIAASVAPTVLQASPTVAQPIDPAPVGEPRPAFRQTPIDESPTAPMRPRFRPAAPPPVATDTPVLPLVPASPSRAEQQVEQQLQQRPVRPYPNLPPRPLTTAVWKKMLVLTGGIAAAIGVSFGLALRFSAARSPQGGSMFHAEQAFPQRDWKGTLTPEDKGDGPIEESLANPPAPTLEPASESPFSPEPMIESPPPAASPSAASPEAIVPDAAMTNGRSETIATPKKVDRRENAAPPIPDAAATEPPPRPLPPRPLPPRQVETEVPEVPPANPPAAPPATPEAPANPPTRNPKR